jgi:hypothetical protein
MEVTEATRWGTGWEVRSRDKFNKFLILDNVSYKLIWSDDETLKIAIDDDLFMIFTNEYTWEEVVREIRSKLLQQKHL